MAILTFTPHFVQDRLLYAGKVYHSCPSFADQALDVGGYFHWRITADGIAGARIADLSIVGVVSFSAVGCVSYFYTCPKYDAQTGVSIAEGAGVSARLALFQQQLQIAGGRCIFLLINLYSRKLF